MVILTVLPEEYDAICDKLQNLSRWPGDKESNNIYAWQMGIVPSSTMAKKHPREAFYVLDDPHEAAVCSMLLELAKEMAKN